MLVEPTKQSWMGRHDPLDGQAGNRWHHGVQMGPSQEPGAINILGFACDEGVFRNQGRIGAKQGPQHLRAALANLAIHQPLHLRDLGDVACHDKNLETAQGEYAGLAMAAMRKGQFVAGLGGGHEIGFASFAAFNQACPQGTLGILNFDAHFDLRRDNQRTSGTWALDAFELAGPRLKYCVFGVASAANTSALFHTAQRHGAHFRLDERLTLLHLEEARKDLESWLDQVDHVYLTVCLDVFPAGYAPGVSAPAALGIAPEVVEALVKVAIRSRKVALMDVAELNPLHDVDSRTARLGARLVYQAVNTLVGQ
ncbi:MAG: formimidoylglutamase [Armatimonadetes bacterium]|nr:formimidoylglutamase [Armatimonadota bacterium]